MAYLSDLLETVKHRVHGPACIALGSPGTVSWLAGALAEHQPTCFQMDLFQAEKLQENLTAHTIAANVVTGADLWDLAPTFQTVILPAAAQADRELKYDMIDQAWHLLPEGGTLITLSEYERDNQIAKIHKKIFGKCGETPSSKAGMAFFSTKIADDRPRRRHETNFHAKLGDGPSMDFLSRPGVFSYGRFDEGSRALVEVAELVPDEHVLDLGCGVGAVGCLASTRTGRGARTTFIDSHLRAVELTKINVAKNDVPNATVVANASMDGLPTSGFDAILANPPYYGDSMVARLFVAKSRDLLKPGGRFYIVTKMPTAVVPLVFESFGGCDVLENRGYSIVTAVSH